MEIKPVIQLEATINDQTCTFTMPTGISFGNAIDAAHQIYTEVIKMAADAAEKAKPKKEATHAQE
jgi:hypothetical protein